MHPAISVNTLSYAPAGLDSHAETTARLGARGISPDLEQVLAFGAGPTARNFRDAGLAVAALTHRAFGFATPEETQAARERLSRTIGIAHEIGAGSVIMTTGGRGTLRWDEARDMFAAAVAPCAQQARAAGITLGIEPTSHLYADVSIAHRLSDTVEIARRAGIAVMVDVFACWVDADLDEALAKAAPLAGVAQICDYAYGDRGLPCRAVPGDGAIPLERIVSGLAGAGFRGWYDLEIIGPRLQAEGQESGLMRAGAYIGALLEQAGVAQ